VSTPSLWQIQAPSRGHERLRGDVSADVCIVGAGVTGGACAWRLLEHGLRPVVLDAREVAASASGRNGGFAVGSSDAATDQALGGMEAMAAELGVAGAVRRRGSLWLGGVDDAHEVHEAVAAARADGLPVEDALDRVPEPMRGRFVAAAFFPGDGELEPARWVRALVNGAADRGAAVHELSPAIAVERRGGGWVVRTPDGSVGCQAVVVACDGLIPDVAPELAGYVYPVRGQMLATEPLPPERRVLWCPTHSGFGFWYYRPTADGRIALGGGRLADLEAEYTEVEQTTPAVQAALERFLAADLGLPGVAITHRWAGVMGFSADLVPLAGEVPERPGLYVSGGYSGVGNVNGWRCGRLVADLIATGAHPDAAHFAPARFGDGPPPEPVEKAASRALLEVPRGSGTSGTGARGS
jgi:glycine/D-amino acid oxidase-like deaminating enzyme